MAYILIWNNSNTCNKYNKYCKQHSKTIDNSYAKFKLNSVFMYYLQNEWPFFISV